MKNTTENEIHQIEVQYSDQILFMKKTYDWSLRLWVTVTNSQRKFEIVTSVHTNIHQLKIQIAKILDLPILDTHIDIYYRSDRPLKATSTLLQNEVTNNAQLTAVVTRSKPAVQLPIEEKGKKVEVEAQTSNARGKGSPGNLGLSVVSSCTNPKCVNYNQKVQVNYGYGTFSILHVTSETKCSICPYKSQYLRPSMLCHQIKIEKCYYKLSGISLDTNGIPVPQSSGFLKALHQKELNKFIADRPWHHNMELVVKHL